MQICASHAECTALLKQCWGMDEPRHPGPANKSLSLLAEIWKYTSTTTYTDEYHLEMKT